jgi:hypothetical protein
MRILAGLILALAAGLIGCSPALPQAGSGAGSGTEGAIQQIGIAQATWSHKQNAVKAKDQFAGKSWMLVCEIRSVGDGPGGTLKVADGCPGTPAPVAIIEMQPSQRDKVGKLKPGQTVLLRATVKSVEAQSMSLGEGEIIDASPSVKSLQDRGIAPPWDLYSALIKGKKIEEANAILGKKARTAPTGEKSSLRVFYKLRISSFPDRDTEIEMWSDDGIITIT